jgi:2-dehydro-3-deoxygluconokinase
MNIDVVTFGEAMIRLSPPNFGRLEQARSLDLQVGGAELNTAVCLSRLGRSSAWVSRLSDNPLGRLVANRARETGVSTEHVLFTPEDRVGLYFLEFGAAPRSSSVWYDRRGAAIANVQPGMFDWQTILRGIKWFHVTGITPALSASAAAVTGEALAAAGALGVRTSIDLNYRAKLWSTAQASRCMIDLMRHCDVLVATEEDVEKVLDIRANSIEEMAVFVANQFKLHAVAVTIRVNPLVWRNSWTAILFTEGQVLRTRTYELEIIDRLGAGDSFAAGLIHGLLDGDAQKGLDYGVAASALKHSIPGDFAWITREEVEAVLTGQGLRIRR